MDDRGSLQADCWKSLGHTGPAWLCAEAWEYYLKVAASLLPKQMETESRRTGSLSQLSDAELVDLVLDGTEVMVEAILVSRGHAPLTIVERQQLQDCEHRPLPVEEKALHEAVERQPILQATRVV